MIDLERINEVYPDTLLMDGFDECLLGIVTGMCIEPKACYSTSKIIAQLMKDGLTESDAMEHFSFNISGAYVGEHTPVFLEDDL